MFNAIILAVPLLLAAAPPAPGSWRGVDAHVATLERAITSSPQDLAAVAWLHERWHWRHEDTQPSRLRALFTRVVSMPQAHPLVKDHAAWLLGQAHLEAMDAVAARSAQERLGIIRGFHVVGPFENTGGASFGTATPVENGGVPTGTFDGLSRQVTWHRVEDVGPGGVLNLHDHVWPSDDVLAYALAFIHSTVEQDAALRVGASDQVAAWVNGVGVLQVDGIRALGMDQHVAAVRLRKGWNRVLFKVGQQRGGWRLLARISAPNGGPLVGVTTSVDASVAAEAAGATPLVPSTPATDLFSELTIRARTTRSDDGQTWMDLAWARDHLHADDEREIPPARSAALQELLRAHPNHAAALTALALMDLPVDVNRAQSRLTAALGADPRHAPAWLHLGLLKARQELPLEARRALERAAEGDATFTTAALSLHEERASQGPDAEAPMAAVAALVRRRPSVAALDGLMRMQLNRGWTLAAADTTTRLRTLLPGHPGARSALQSVLRRRGDTAALERDLRADITLAPHHASRVQQLATLLCNTGRCPEADALLAAHATTHPQDASTLQALAEVKLRRGDEAGGMAALRAVLALRPQDAAARRRVEMLSREETFEARHALDIRALSAEPPPPGAAAAGAYALGHLAAHRLYDNGLTTQVVDMAYRLLDRARAPVLQQLQAAYVPTRETLDVLVAERLTSDGRVIPARVEEEDPTGREMGVYTDTRRVVVDFGVPEPGDVVRLRYRVDAAGERNLFGDFFGATEFAQEAIPKAHYTVVVEAPASRPLASRVVGLPAVSTSTRNGNTVYRVDAGPLPALVLEPAMPAYTEVGAYAVFSSYASWEEMGRWYAALVRDQLVPDAALRDVTARLVQGATTDAEKVRRIHAYVLERTRYVGIELGIHGWKPYRVGQVHARGYGDCKDKASLMVAMFKLAGVDARLVLLRTFDQGPVVDLPSMWHFNHAIAYVPALDVFLDGTAEFSGMAELPHMDQQAMALTVNVDNGAIQRVSPPLAPARQNLNESNYVITLDGRGGMTLQGEEKFGGQRAPTERMRLQERGTQQATVERDFTQLYPGATISDVVVSDPRALDQPLVYGFRAAVPSFGEAEGPLLRVPVTLYPHELTREYAPTATRTHDVVTGFPFFTRNKMRFVLPAGATLQELPRGGAVTSPHVDFEQAITRTTDGYEVVETLHIKSRRIPVADYGAFRAAMLEADRLMRTRVVYRSPSVAVGVRP